MTGVLAFTGAAAAVLLLATVEVFGVIAKWRLRYWTRQLEAEKERGRRLDAERAVLEAEGVILEAQLRDRGLRGPSTGTAP